MNRAGLGAAVALIGMVAAGCGHISVWQWPGSITPSSYRASNPRVVRTVGKLRRLAAVPPRIVASREQETPPLGGLLGADVRGSGDPLGARRILTEVKDYEIIPIDLYRDLSHEKFGLSAEQLDAGLEAIKEWVRDAADGQEPPADVARAVSCIGHGLRADGLLVVQIALGRRIEGWVDIVEIASGRAVWRLRFEGKAKELIRASAELMKVEQAIPSAVTGQ